MKQFVLTSFLVGGLLGGLFAVACTPLDSSKDRHNYRFEKRDACFESGGVEYWDSTYASGPGSYCVYRK